MAQIEGEYFPDLVPVLEKICNDSGTAMETCTAFVIRSKNGKLAFTDRTAGIAKESNGTLLFKPFGLASFDEKVGKFLERRWVLSLIDNSGSPSRSEERFVILDSAFRAITKTPLSYQERDAFLRTRKAAPSEEVLKCDTPRQSQSQAAKTESGAGSQHPRVEDSGRERAPTAVVSERAAPLQPSTSKSDATPNKSSVASGQLQLEGRWRCGGTDISFSGARWMMFLPTQQVQGSFTLANSELALLAEQVEVQLSSDSDQQFQAALRAGATRIGPGRLRMMARLTDGFRLSDISASTFMWERIYQRDSSGRDRGLIPKKERCHRAS